jgi:hypothetical protein
MSKLNFMNKIQNEEKANEFYINLTKKEYIAIQLFQANIVKENFPDPYWHNDSVGLIAENSIKYADILLKKLEENKK